MKSRDVLRTIVVLFFLLSPLPAESAGLTDFDSTQPRGFNELLCIFNATVVNDQGQDLCPVEEGFRAPQRVGEGTKYHEWSGTMMANATRDPAFFSTLAVANQDFINLLYAAAAKGLDTFNPELNNLVGVGTAREVVCALKLYDPDFGDPCTEGGEIQLLDEDQLPVTADICLRCHTPPGWMEGHSEPFTPHAPFLKGQFWGAAFLENPVNADGTPRSVDVCMESEGEMDGIHCDFCHRSQYNYTYKRQSRYDGTPMVAGNGGFFADRDDTVLWRHHLREGSTIPEDTAALTQNPGGLYNCFSCHQYDVSLGFLDIKVVTDCAYCHQNTTGQVSGGPGDGSPPGDIEEPEHFCGTCHDVTNPLVITQTPGVDRMLHPIERTYTEWFWSDYRDEQNCEDCHRPMSFEGAHTWLLYPGLDDLWGDVDQKWALPPYNYPVNPSRQQAYMDAMQKNLQFMQQHAADIEIIDAPVTVSAGQQLTVNVKVTNKTGHKLPTGFVEGRQMWIHLKATDDGDNLIFNSGYMLPDGSLARKEYFEAAQGGTVSDPVKAMIKVYEQLVLAKGYDTFELDGYNILDADKDGIVTHEEEEFHFVLMNYIEKDNRIPPRGFNKEAYQADGAFIIPYNPKDTDYPSGQHWDITPYTFTVPADIVGNLHITVRLFYQSFNREYVEFLDETDVEDTEETGGRARNLPAGPYEDFPTWGSALYQLWLDNDNGRPVEMGSVSADILVE
jgi:hypothetical protein